MYVYFRNDDEQNGSFAGLLVAHCSWVLALAKLEQLGNLDRPTNQSILDEASDLSVYTTFRPNEPIKSDARVSPENWRKWFGRGRLQRAGADENKSSPRGKRDSLRTVYELRPFYALEAPNNLAQRLANLAGILNASDAERRVTTNHSTSKYDEYIYQWGNYALNLVSLNGGWRRFLSVCKLTQLQDYWPSASCAAPDVGSALDRDSFIQRVIALAKDKYIQVLTNPVGVMWPLWFLRDRNKWNLLSSIQNQESRAYRIGPSLSRQVFDSMYVEVNTQVGSLKDLPFPFGYADEALKRQGGPPPGRVWQMEHTKLVAQDLREQFWSPPLLFGTRPDLLSAPVEIPTNESVPMLKIAGPCPTFSSVHSSLTAIGKPLADLRIYSIPNGWSAPLMTELRKLNPQGHFEVQQDTQHACKLPSPLPDLVLSHFPVDVPIEASGHYERLSTSQIYHFSEHYANQLNYSLPATVLAGGMFLARQPFMPRLLQELSRILAKIEALFRQLSPVWENLPERYQALLSQKHPEQKKEAAVHIAQYCDYVKSSPLMRHSPLRNLNIKDLLVEIGVAMNSVLFSQADQDVCRCHYEDWAWARLLEQLQYTEVYLSHYIYLD